MPAFRGEYFYLSNFYPCNVEFRGVHFLCSETAYQASKTGDDPRVLAGWAMTNARDSKRDGRYVKLRTDWEKVKLNIMREIVHCKFDQNEGLGKKLAATTHELVEENEWHDYFWGVCDGRGQNWLGRILMEEREVQRKKWGLGSSQAG